MLGLREVFEDDGCLFDLLPVHLFKYILSFLSQEELATAGLVCMMWKG